MLSDEIKKLQNKIQDQQDELDRDKRRISLFSDKVSLVST